jgi:endogenous inhibitor of DNA gyrase (YacG/DUF329 family)
MVKCPWCGKDIPAEEYGKHYEVCPQRLEQKKVTVGKYKDLEQLLRELYEVERTLSAILQSYTYLSGLIHQTPSLEAIVHDTTGARDQLREIMRSMGWRGPF